MIIRFNIILHVIFNVRENMYLRLKHYEHINGDIMNTNLNKNKENIISAILVILGAFVYISLVR